jgi:hypothetical protein
MKILCHPNCIPLKYYYYSNDEKVFSYYYYYYFFFFKFVYLYSEKYIHNLKYKTSK